MIAMRPETPADIPAIRRVIEAAFGQTAEVVLVDQLRDDGDLVLSLVAEDAGVVVGHIAFSRLEVEDAAARFDALALAPIAVHPSRQGEGIGSGLVRTAHDMLRQRGEHLIVVLGDPDYYQRFGYDRERAEGFESSYQSDSLMALALDGAAPRSGQLRYAFAFTEL
jgi:putative acetyltransferase